MNFEDIDIHELLPQKEPFVMVGMLKYFDMGRTATETEIKGENLMVDNAVFSSYGIIENIAQTCAVRIGYINKYIFNREIRLGFIGAIKNMHIYSLPKVGDTIETEILTIEEVFGMTLVKASVRHDGEILCECEMKIALNERVAEI